MNEVTLHRGRSPHLNTIDAYVNGQHLTEAVVSSFSHRKLSAHIPREVGRPHSIHANRFNGVLPLMRRSYRAPLSARLAPHTSLSSKSKFQTTRATKLVTYHPSGPFFITFSYASLLSASPCHFRSTPEVVLQPKYQWMDKRRASCYRVNRCQSKHPLTLCHASTARPLRTTFRMELKMTGYGISTHSYNSTFHSRTRIR
jgi:hypothetical protein